jgi:hypothetical protein
MNLNFRKCAGLGGHACNISTQEIEAGGLGVQGQPWLYSEFLASLGDTMKPYKKKSEKKFRK